MPDKRQTSKQRRAARNRANRQALAARRDNAVAGPAPSARSSASSGPIRGRSRTRGAAGASANGAAAATSAPPPGGFLDMLRSKQPGTTAVPLAALLALGGSVMTAFTPIAVDADGDPWPRSFTAVAKLAQGAQNDGEIPDRTATVLSAYGPIAILWVALPLVIAGFALWAMRRPDRARLLTFAMVGMAASVILGGGNLLTLGSVVALSIGGFRVRKADLPARTAESVTARSRRARGRGGVIDADSTEVTDHEVAGDDVLDDEVLDDEVTGDEVAGDEGAGDEVLDHEVADDEVLDDAESGADAHEAGAGESGDEVEYDPLAELEAEIEAERTADDDERR